MRTTGRQALPLAPLLHAYAAAGPPSIAELHRLPGLGGRFAAVLGASARFLYADFLTAAPDDRLRDALLRFYEQAVGPPVHAAELARRAGFVRHGLAHLLHGHGPAAARLEACVSATGAYRVPGLGPSFWSAILQGAAPARHPAWTAATRAGLARLGGEAGGGPVAVYEALAGAHARIRAARPEMTALHIDHFLSLLSLMTGRGLHDGAAELAACRVTAALRRLRAARPLRQRLKEQGEGLAAAQRAMAAALEAGDVQAVTTLAGERRLPDGLLDAARQWWAADDPYPALARWWQSSPGAGLALPAAILHLRDPQRFFPFSDPHRQGLATLDDGLDPADPPAERYRLFNAAGAWLRQKHALHPLELPDLLALLAEPDDVPETPPAFGGLCPDTFAFLGELGQQNSRAWMQQQRGRYEFAVRTPLTELCQALAARYVEPVLRRTHGWDVETASRGGRALTRICKNAFGKGGPYHSAMWITFCPRAEGRGGPQLFVRLAPEGVRYGLRLGAGSAARERMRLAVERHAECLARLLTDNGALNTCRFGPADRPAALAAITCGDELRRWAAGRSLEASVGRPAGDGLLSGEALVGDIVVTFDRLLPLFACAAEADPSATLSRLGGEAAGGFREADFCRDTYLGPHWLRRALDLLAIKKQLILQGHPGTGKTHVARALARLLTAGHDEAVRLVQFHPAYSYEEFVEGIKVRSVPVEGRHEVSYPVEDGLLCAFAARAAARPSEPHVLVIDEINRGNLPRIFGELLFLLEYREQAVVLPYSRRSFGLPANLYLIATMNAADRSVAPIDQALRRRFSFIDMAPDAEVVGAWLSTHSPTMRARVVALFEKLNARLRAEAGPLAQVGHSYFMVKGLDEARLRVVWRHHVRPLLDDLFAGQPGRAAAYDALLEAAPGRPAAREKVHVHDE